MTDLPLTLRDLVVAIVAVGGFAAGIAMSQAEPYGFAPPMYEGSKHCAKHAADKRCAPRVPPIV
jgi:hypothetical protein